MDDKQLKHFTPIYSMSTVVEFLVERKIKSLPVNLKIDSKTGKKTYLTGEKGKFSDGRRNFQKDDFDKWTVEDCLEFYEEYMHETDYIAIDTSEVQQLDIDDKTGEFWESDAALTYTNGPYFLSLTKQMPHIFMHTDYKAKHCQEIAFDHDVLTNVWAFARSDQAVENADAPIPTLNFTAKKDTSAAQKPPQASLIFQESVVDLIAVNPYLDEYQHWMRIVAALKNAGFDKEFARKISMKSDKYEAEAFDKMWCANLQHITMGTLNHYAKLSNPEEYSKLYAKKDMSSEFNDTDFALAEKFFEMEGDDMIYQNDVLYLYHNNKWIVDAKCQQVKMRFQKTMCLYVNDVLREYIKAENKTGIKETSAALRKVQGYKKVDDCVKALITILATKHTDVKFDVGVEQFYNLHFQNGVSHIVYQYLRLTPSLKLISA